MSITKELAGLGPRDLAAVAREALGLLGDTTLVSVRRRGIGARAGAACGECTGRVSGAAGLARRTEAQHQGRARSTVESLEARLGCPAASLPDGAPISAGTLRMIACDAKVIPVVLGGDSQPLEIGRSRYSVPPQLRRAMFLRDRNVCAFPRCGTIPRVAHHISPWHRYGETKLDNLVSLCGHHHRWIHQSREQLITPVEGGRPRFDLGPAP